MIKGGYILQPRIIQESDISVAPPYVREIWNYLLREANCQDNKYNGHEIKRGQLFRSYEDIRDGTKWFIGWRKMTYNENQTKKAMKYLRDTMRIATTKELGGVMITICKYDFYQTPKNYERTTKEPIERTIGEPRKNQPLPDNNKNEEEGIKNEKNNTWRDNFNVYLSECKLSYKKFTDDKELIKVQQRLHPNINILLSIEKGFINFWGTEAGWKHKKKNRSKEIDWKMTIINSIDMNKVYYTKEELSKL